MDLPTPDAAPIDPPTLTSRPRRDPPPPKRMIFDITPRWWGASVPSYFNACAMIAETIGAHQSSLITAFLGSIREIRVSVTGVEIECIDTRRTASEEGPDYTPGGDRAILVHVLNQLEHTVPAHPGPARLDVCYRCDKPIKSGEAKARHCGVDRWAHSPCVPASIVLTAIDHLNAAGDLLLAKVNAGVAKQATNGATGQVEDDALLREADALAAISAAKKAVRRAQEIKRCPPAEPSVRVDPPAGWTCSIEVITQFEGVVPCAAPAGSASRAEDGTVAVICNRGPGRFGHTTILPAEPRAQAVKP